MHLPQFDEVYGTARAFCRDQSDGGCRWVSAPVAMTSGFEGDLEWRVERESASVHVDTVAVA